MGPNGGSVAMDSGLTKSLIKYRYFTNKTKVCLMKIYEEIVVSFIKKALREVKLFSNSVVDG